MDVRDPGAIHGEPDVGMCRGSKIMETLGKYGSLEKLGDKPFGTVFKAFDGSNNRHVAIRTIGPVIKWDPVLKERFNAECRAILGLSHPNLAALYEYGEEGTPYVAMELLPGRDLKTLIAEKAPITVEQKLSIMIQVAAGMSYAHDHGVLHRNLQPCNIHVLPEGTVKVGDLGLTGILAPYASPAGVQAESRTYLAPEQIQGQATSRQSDIFSLGIVLYEFLTGIHPFRGDSATKTLDNILYQTQFPTVDRFPELPFGVWSILDKCLAKDVEERFATMTDFGAACRGLVEELAEDSQLMRIELRTALPRLRKAARKPGAPKRLKSLQNDVENALAGGDESNYQSLNRLIASLAEQHRVLSPDSDSVFPMLPVLPGATCFELPEDPSRGATRVPGPDTALAGSALDERQPAPAELSNGSSFGNTHGNVSAAGERRQNFGVTRFGAKASDEPPPLTRSSEKSPVKPLTYSSPQTSTDRKSPPPGAFGKDRVSELLIEIDEGQESTRKTVENFLRGRQARQSGGDDNPMVPVSPRSASARPVNVLSPLGPQSALPGGIVGPGTSPIWSYARLVAVARRLWRLAVSRLGTWIDLSTALGRREVWSAALWICAAAGLLALAVAIPYWIQTRNGPQVAKSPVPGNPQVATLTPVASTESADANPNPGSEGADAARKGVLLQEAQALRAAGRVDESKAFLNRLLELDPGNQPAQKELDSIQGEADSAKLQESGTQSVQRLLAAASSAIKAGNLLKAGTDLDKAERAKPGLAETAALRKRLQARKLELDKSAATEQERQRELAQSQADDRTLSGRAMELYQQGKYADALTILNSQRVQAQPSPLTQEMRNRALEMQRMLEDFESALTAGKHSEALAALENAERLNPTDPNLPGLRRRAEAGSTSGSATLSLYSIGEAAALMFDDKPIGANGEVVNQAVPAGRHKITARNAQGQDVALYFDLNASLENVLVYDVSGQVLRRATEADRDLISRNKTRQQVYRFQVVHSHGFLRGSCKGDLIVSQAGVEYRPLTGFDAFKKPLKSLILRIENKNAVLLTVEEGKEFMVFKIQDPESAQSLKKIWDELASIEK